MSDAQADSDAAFDDEFELELTPPADPLAGHPATAYFWGHVAGSGEVAADGIEVVTSDETSAQVLAAVAGGDLARETTTREYAHDASITRTEEEFTVSLYADAEGRVLGRESVRSLPVDDRGNYRLDAFTDNDRELLRGLLEGCGTICFKSSSGTVGISFVHADRELLALVRELIAECPVEAPVGELGDTSSGGYWFGVDDAAASAFGTWLYEDCEDTGLFAPSRRRKLERSLEQATAIDD
ncbi:cobalamin biosynthesis protein [Natrialba sp. PRR66]|uniref:cobalamin biosynthesis protein n=1 Tax=Natrialba sp. PRR66 TaxID=3098146 RepID=UPI002B1DC791|nr:cobalamin biosynthesis protein [Natrialba sp. PRR66]